MASCPTDAKSWGEAAKKLNCDSVTQNCALSLGLNTQKHRFQYHCLMNSHRNETVEVCALNRLILGKVYDTTIEMILNMYAYILCKTRSLTE